MILFPETFFSVLVWASLGFAALGVILLATLWAKDLLGGKIW